MTEIITIGNELLNGKTLNANATWLADQLMRIGVDVQKITTIGDDAEAILNALAESLHRADIVLITGGLGPTHDDITKKSIADFFDVPLIKHEETESRIKKFFASRGVEASQPNLEQALIPEGAEVIENEIGTAPGFYMERDRKICFVMPGVPDEMKKMTNDSVLLIIKRKFCNRIDSTSYQIIRTASVYESSLYLLLSPLEEIEKFADVAFLPNRFGVDVRLTAKADHEESADKKVETAKRMIMEKIYPYVYEVGEKSLEEVVAELLLQNNYTLSVAESCTGGLVCNLMTDVPGSSNYFLGGVIVYDNSLKMKLVGVQENTLREKGAVSPETAREMAEGIQRLTGSDCAISTTGIAGPTGASPDKPVGLIYIGYIVKDRSFVKRFVFHKERTVNKARFAYASLNELRQKLIESSQQ